MTRRSLFAWIGGGIAALLGRKVIAAEEPPALKGVRNQVMDMRPVLSDVGSDTNIPMCHRISLSRNDEFIYWTRPKD